MNLLQNDDNAIRFLSSLHFIEEFGTIVTLKDELHVKDTDLILSLYEAIDAPTTYWNSVSFLNRSSEATEFQSDIVAHADRINRFVLDCIEQDQKDAVSHDTLGAQFDSKGRLTASDSAFANSYGLDSGQTLRDLPMFGSDFAQLDVYLSNRAINNVVITLHKGGSNKRQIALISRDKATFGHHLELLGTTLPNHARDPLLQYFSVSQAEFEVLRLIVAGNSIEEIARDRGRGAETIRTHVKSLTRKLGVNSQVELVSRALAIPEVQKTPPSRQKAPVGTVHDGVQYFFIGQPSQPAILYFQQITDGPIVTIALRRALEDAGYCMLSVSRPGVGQTAVHQTEYCIDAAANINRIATHLGLDIKGLLAVGTGLPHALHFAQNYAAKLPVLGLNPIPPMISSTVIKRMPGRWRGFGMLAHRMPFLVSTVTLLAARFFARDPAHHALKILQDEIDQELPQSIHDDIIYAISQNQSLNAEHTARHFPFEAILVASAWDKSMRAKCPDLQITLVQGQGRFTIPTDHMYALAERLPNATVRLIPENVDPIHLVAPEVAVVEIERAFNR